MKTPLKLACVSVGVALSLQTARATAPMPGGGGPYWLDYWSFDDTNTLAAALGYAPLSFTNITLSPLGDRWAAVVDQADAPAWLCYNIDESDGTNHLRLDRGSVLFWFAPNWTGTNAGGSGPGEWSRLIEVGACTTNASYGWWSLYTDPAGANLYFSAQTNDGSGATYLCAPIQWDVTNRWHLIALTYSETNSALWVDEVLLTNGAPVAYWPPADVLTNGFFIGSDSGGQAQAHGMFDDLATYNYEIDGATISNTFSGQAIWYYGNPMNRANFASASSTPRLTPLFNAVTGRGDLKPVSTNLAGCFTNSGVWLTNLVVAAQTNHGMDIQFGIAGGADDSTPYDVFANSVLDFSTNRTVAWAWMGQGYHCVTYSLTNLPALVVFARDGYLYGACYRGGNGYAPPRAVRHDLPRFAGRWRGAAVLALRLRRAFSRSQPVCGPRPGHRRESLWNHLSRRGASSCLDHNSVTLPPGAAWRCPGARIIPGMC